MSDEEAEDWWNLFKDSALWSGAIAGLSWHELWPEVQAALKEIAAYFQKR